ncbi:MAG: hypothetical protein IGS39_02320 [Calothrix sp. C42_A2020_038]|nr:hypothetical protein [Calothrix sp. C42_A2020_038]
MYKNYFKITVFSSALVLMTLPAMAGLGNIWTDFQAYSNDLRNYVVNNLSDTLKPYEVQTQTAINNSSGAIGIPNPNTAGKIVQDQITQYSLSEKFETNSAVNGAIVKNKIGRHITLGAVESTLGRNGQSQTRNKLQNAEKAVNDIISIANTAETNKRQKQIEIQAVANANPLNNLSGFAADANPISSLIAPMLNQSKLTQLTWEGLADLELQNINQRREQSKLIAATLGTTVHIHQDLQYTNLNLTNISQQIDETNRARRVDTSAEVARLLQVTSQTDLLGRR